MTELIITPSWKGHVTAFDILQTSGVIHFVTEKSALKVGGLLFKIEVPDFLFSLHIENQNLIAIRDKTISVLTLEKTPDKEDLKILLRWDYTELTLKCIYGKGEDTTILKSVVPTPPFAPPLSLVKRARKQNMIPTETYASEEYFRNRVHSCLQSIQDKIDKSGGHTPFWNIEYEGQKIKDRQPKKEVEIHPIIHCLLSDQALISSLEVIPEYKTGVGDIDFMITGRLDNGETSKICIEFKNAHSDDIVHGITNQLPAYMRNTESEYGVYCILNYKGEWFDKPSLSINDLRIKLHHECNGSKDPIQENIRTIVFNLSKAKSASKI